MEEKIGNEMRPRGTRQMAIPKHRTPPLLVVFILFLILLLCGSSFVAWNLYRDKQDASHILQTDDKKTVIINIAKHALLPEDEEPVFATVTDPSLLSDQPFFEHAMTGDKVLVYPKTKKAILYRPTSDRIIEMAPFDPARATTPSTGL